MSTIIDCRIVKHFYCRTFLIVSTGVNVDSGNTASISEWTGLRLSIDFR